MDTFRATSLNEVSDSNLILATKTGDTEAFDELFLRYKRKLFAVVLRIVNNREDAEEVVQEAFLRAYQKLGQFAARSNFGTLVYRSAANYAIDRMRQRQKEDARRETPRAEDKDGMENDPLNHVQDKAPTPERLTQSIELRKQLELALAALSDAERTAFVMRHWEGCGIEEIAGVLKSSSNATKNTVFRAVQKLRHALQPYLETKAQARAMGTES